MKRHTKTLLCCVFLALLHSPVVAQTSNATYTPRINGDIPRFLAPQDLANQLGVGASGRSTPPREIDNSVVQLLPAVRRAVNWHPAISDSIATLAQQAGGVDVARAGYYPQVKGGLGSGDNTQGGRYTLASASLSQMLYDFGKTSGSVNQAQAQLRKQQALVLKQIDMVAQQTAESVVALHRYQRLQAIAKTQVQAIEKVRELTLLRSEAGLSSRSDPIQALSRLDDAKSNLLQVTSLHEQARERLRTLLGAPIGNSAGPLDDLDQEVAALQRDQPADLRLVPDVLAAEADRQVAVAQLSVAQAQRYPTISLDGSVDRAITGSNPATLNQRGSNRTIMLNFSAPIYQGGALSAQVSAAVNALEAARQRVDTARLNAGDQARLLMQQMEGARQRLSVLDERKRSITEVRDLFRDQYMLGTRSILDLLNAEQEFYQAAADQESVRHDMWASLVGYIGATGMNRDFYHLNNEVVQGMELRP